VQYFDVAPLRLQIVDGDAFRADAKRSGLGVETLGAAVAAPINPRVTVDDDRNFRDGLNEGFYSQCPMRPELCVRSAPQPA
jgi:hypothetical protein